MNDLVWSLNHNTDNPLWIFYLVQLHFTIKQSLFLVLAALAVFTTSAFASLGGTSTPPVGTSITNKATLNYTGYDNESRRVESYPIVVYVGQIYLVDIDPDNTIRLAPGDIGNFMHTVSNWGNGPDDIKISMEAGHLDADYGFEVLKESTPGNFDVSVGKRFFNGTDWETTGDFTLKNIAAWSSINILVKIGPTDKNDDDLVEKFEITATSLKAKDEDQDIKDMVTDTINYTDNAAITVYKALSTVAYKNSITGEDVPAQLGTSVGGYRDSVKKVTVGLDIRNTAKEAASGKVTLTDDFTLDNPNMNFEFLEGTKVVWGGFKHITGDTLVTPGAPDSASEQISLIKSGTGLTAELVGETPIRHYKATYGGGEKSFYYRVKVTASKPTDSTANTFTKLIAEIIPYASLSSTTPSGDSVITIAPKYSGILSFETSVKVYPTETVEKDKLIYNKVGVKYNDGTTTTVTEYSNKVSYEVWSTRYIAIVPDKAGKTYIGGQITYTHKIYNYGDVKEGTGALTSFLTVATSDSKNNYESKVYLDRNHNGKFDGDTIDIELVDLANTDVAGIEPGDFLDILVVVKVPSSAKINDVDITDIVPTVTRGIYARDAIIKSAKDTTYVYGDFLTIDKYQSTTGKGDSYTKNNKTIKPGELIYYKIVAHNTWTPATDGDLAIRAAKDKENTAEGVEVIDTIPIYTTLAKGIAETETEVGISHNPTYYVYKADGTEDKEKTSLAQVRPKVGDVGEIKAIIGTLLPGEKAELYFNVKIDYEEIAKD